MLVWFWRQVLLPSIYCHGAMQYLLHEQTQHGILMGSPTRAQWRPDDAGGLWRRPRPFFLQHALRRNTWNSR